MEAYDIVKTELTDRLKPVCEQYKSRISHVKGIERLTAWSEHLKKNTEEFSKIMTDTLNQIIAEQKIEFKDEEEKQKFLEYIRPTNVTILKDFASF